MVSPAVALCVFKVFLCQGSYCLCAMGGNISVELKPPQGGKGRGRRDYDEEQRGSWGRDERDDSREGRGGGYGRGDRWGRDEEAMDSWSGGDRKGGGKGSWWGGGRGDGDGRGERSSSWRDRDEHGRGGRSSSWRDRDPDSWSQGPQEEWVIPVREGDRAGQYILEPTDVLRHCQVCGMQTYIREGTCLNTNCRVPCLNQY